MKFDRPTPFGEAHKVFKNELVPDLKDANEDMLLASVGVKG